MVVEVCWCGNVMVEGPAEWLGQLIMEGACLASGSRIEGIDSGGFLPRAV